MTEGLGKFIMNPFTLLFLTVFLGIVLGKIKIKKFSFGACGALIVGLVIGWGVVLYAKSIDKLSPLYKTASKLTSGGVISEEFFNFFLILFVVSLGLISGKQVVTALKKYGMKFLTIGFVISLTGFILTFGLIKASNVNPYQLSGVYSGSMLSTPAFAVSLDVTEQQVNKLSSAYPKLSQVKKQKVLNMIDKNLKAENVSSLNSEQKSKLLAQADNYTSMGHSITYPVGVILGIIMIVFIPRIFGFKMNDEREKFNSTMKNTDDGSEKKVKEAPFNIASFGLTAFLGTALGSVDIKNFSLGIAGGALIAALILSAIGRVGPINFRMDDNDLGVVKTIGLTLFLATIGLNYGYSVVESLSGPGLTLIVIGLIILFISIMVAYVVGRYVFKLDWLALSGAICGGITNTPTLGAAIDSVEGNEPAVGYGAVYPFALIFKIIFAIIVLRLFLI